MKKTVLITGSNGLLGQHLTQVLKEHNDYNIVATGRGEDRLCDDGYTYFSLDVSDIEDVKRVISRVEPSIIFHCAAISKVEICEDNNEEALQQNVEATRYLLNIGKQNSLEHFIFISTDFVFDGDKGLYEEEDERNPPNFYGETKLLAENIVKEEADITTSIVRTCLVYGQVRDMSRTNIMLWVKNKLSNNENINVVNDQYRTPTYAKDLAEGCYLIAKKNASGVFHISGKDYLTPYEIAIKVSKYLNLPTKKITAVNASTFKEHGRRPLKTGFTNKKAYDILNYSPISFDKGMIHVLNNTEK